MSINIVLYCIVLYGSYVCQGNPSGPEHATLNIKPNPRLDKSGVIRSLSCFEFVDYLPYDTKFLIILPRGQWVTKLIV